MSKELKGKIEEVIYFALTNWDMNPMTKGFAKALTKEIDKIIGKHLEGVLNN